MHKDNKMLMNIRSAELLTALDYLFENQNVSIYNMYEDETREEQNLVRRKIKVDYSQYKELLNISKILDVSVEELLEYIIVLYTNIYKISNKGHEE